MLAQHYTCQLMSAIFLFVSFFNFKYYLTCAYAIIRSILTKKKFLTVHMVWLILDGHTYLINERKKLVLYKIYLLWINSDKIGRGCM